MPRFVKSFAVSDPVNAQVGQPTSNQFTIDLSGLPLNDEVLGRIRQEAVRAALVAAANILPTVGLGGVLDAFGTFSTFSTFSTFGSGAGFPGETGIGLPTGIKSVIDRVVGGGRGR